MFHRLVRQNFIEKAVSVARIVPTMTIIDNGRFVLDDCGLASDTFNVIVACDLSTPHLLLQDGVGYFTAKQTPMALWYWEEALGRQRMTTLVDYGLVHADECRSGGQLPCHAPLYQDVQRRTGHSRYALCRARNIGDL